MDRDKKKAFIQDTIIQALFSLLEDKSWESLSSDEICKKAGVSKRTLYAYFHSQDEMYLELVKRSFERMNVTMGNALNQGNDVEDKIINLGMAYIQFMLKNPVEGTLILNFDEKRYKGTYVNQVNDIHNIANKYELMHLFQELNLDTKVFDSQLAIFLWSHIQGVAQLLHSKGEWMEEYYDVSIHRIVESQMKLARKMLGGIK